MNAVRHVAWLAPAVAVAMAVACSKTPPPVAKPPVSPPDELAAAEQAAEPATQRPTQPPASEPEVGPESEQPAPQRVVLFTPDGPMRLDLVVTLNGVSQAREVAAFAEEIVSVIDADGDGVARWDELSDEGTRARLTAIAGAGVNGQETDEARRFYDADGDGRIDPAEALAWLQRTAAADTPRFDLRVFGQRAYEPDPRGEAMWRALDTDADGALSAAEIEASAQRLLAFDATDDRAIGPRELVALEDLARLRAERAGMAPDRTTSDLAYRAGLVLRQDRDTLDVRDAMALLSPRGDVGRGAFGAAARLFDRLDDNGDGFLLDREWRRLRGGPAPARLAVAFVDDGADTAGGGDRLEIRPPAANGLEPSLTIASSGETRCRLALPRGVMVVELVDGYRLAYGALEKIAAAIRDNPNEALTEEEYEAVADRPSGLGFATIGPGSDALIDADDLARFVRLAGASERLPVAITVASGGDALFGLLDADQDGRLGEPELFAASGRLSDLAGTDGRLQPSEAPWRMTVTVHRGRPGPSTVVNASLMATKAIEAPRWFVGADFNGDGVVSRAEHIGDAQSFARLDRDGDGFLEVGEAVATESMTAER